LRAPARRAGERPRRSLEALLGAGTARGWPAYLAVALLVGAIPPLLLTLGTGFLPEMDEGSLILDFNSPPGTSASETERILTGVERQIGATPDIASWSGRIGDQLGFFITEPNRGDYVLRLKQGRRRDADDVIDDLRHLIETRRLALGVQVGELSGAVV